MTIAPGTRLGPFEVVSLLAAGGMGAVYRAHDPRLRRDVAIKVLPPGFVGDPNRLRRFEQEALAVARLAHPCVVAVYDVGTCDGSPYLVTELLEGSTLRETMNGRALPVRRALEIARQVGDGLTAAHRQGIVHRDIKPENIFVTREGRIKILDFGIARLTDAGEATETAITLTGFGVIGTAAYMAPEQARGAQVDQRADLFSLGVVLYELLTGISPFRRETPAETMAAILKDPVPDLPEGLAPPGVMRIVRHCLEKDPIERFQSAPDLVFSLDAVMDPALLPVAAARRTSWKRPVLAALVVPALATAVAAAFLGGRWTAEPEAVFGASGIFRFSDFAGLEEFPAIAPDQKAIAFTAWVNGYRQVFVRLTAGGTPLQITKDAVDHQLPRWSRDSSSVIYFSPAAPGSIQGTIWQTPALGGAPRRVIDSVGGGDVGPGGRIACFRISGAYTELVTVSSAGDDVQALARFAEPVYYQYPRWSPDARWIAFQRGDGVRWDIVAVATDRGTIRQISHDNTQIHGLAWLPDSKGLVYSSSRGATMPYLPTQALWQLNFETGETRQIAPADHSYLHPDVHANGAIAASRLRMTFDLWKYPMDGLPAENVRGAVRLTRQSGQVQTPTVGASDRDVAFLSDSGGHANVWVMAADTGEIRQITYERDPDVALGVPIWSPDGKWIGFVSSRGNTGLGFGVWLMSPDGGNLSHLASRGLGLAWSPDSQWVYYVDGGALYKVRTGGGPAVQVRTAPVRNVIGMHGGTLFFVVDRTLTDGEPAFEIHAATPEDAPSAVLARIAAGRAPQWQIVNPSLSPDGQWLAMPLTDGVTTNIWALSTATGKWRQVTDFGERPIFIVRRVSWSTDGRFILAAVGEGDADIVVFEPATREATRIPGSATR